MFNEIFGMYQANKVKFMVFEIDFKEAMNLYHAFFYLKSWGKMGFRTIWCDWVRATLCSVGVLVLDNGVPTSETGVEHDIRHGDM